MNLKLRVWRQRSAAEKGKMVTYEVADVSPDMSFLEMLDVLNEQLIMNGEDPVSFDHDCREGICGSCGVMINGRAHGNGLFDGHPQTATCQLHMRSFKHAATTTAAPRRATAPPPLPRAPPRHRAPRRPPADGDLPAAHAVVQGRRHDRRRAVAGDRVPADQG